MLEPTQHQQAQGRNNETKEWDVQEEVSREGVE